MALQHPHDGFGRDEFVRSCDERRLQRDVHLSCAPDDDDEDDDEEAEEAQEHEQDAGTAAAD